MTYWHEIDITCKFCGHTCKAEDRTEHYDECGRCGALSLCEHCGKCQNCDKEGEQK